jgi:hypothetical protein
MQGPGCQISLRDKGWVFGSCLQACGKIPAVGLLRFHPNAAATLYEPSLMPSACAAAIVLPSGFQGEVRAGQGHWAAVRGPRPGL